MGRTLNAIFRDPVLWLRVSMARANQLIGWAGIGGVALAAAALSVLALAWSAQHAFLQAKVPSSAVVLVAASSAASTQTPVALAETVEPPSASQELSRLADVPLLLTQMEQAALTNGLAWRAADYKVVGASSTKPASLEVRCSIKGTYPQLRSMLVQLMNVVPAFTIREFNVSRPNGDSADIEAKLILAVFLQDGPSDSDAQTKVAP
jgi:hypothetical protein